MLFSAAYTSSDVQARALLQPCYPELSTAALVPRSPLPVAPGPSLHDQLQLWAYIAQGQPPFGQMTP